MSAPEELKDPAAAAEPAAEPEPRHLPVPVAAGVPAPQPRPSSRELAPSAALPVMQAAAVAAGGIVAGAAITGLVQRRRRRSAPAPRPAPRRRRTARAAELVQIVGSRSLLVDVHLLGVPADR